MCRARGCFPKAVKYNVARFSFPGNKNRLSSTTCGEELQKFFKDWQSFKELCQKAPKKSPILSDLRF